MKINLTPVSHKIAKSRINFEYPVRNIHGLDIRVWGYCPGGEPTGFDEPTLSFVLVEKELTKDLKGPWGYCSVKDYNAGLLDRITGEELGAYAPNSCKGNHNRSGVADAKAQ